MAMAGLIADQTKQAINGLPGLTQLPILGTLFRSRDFVNNQTELMVLVTPYIVRAVAQKDLSRPDDGFANAADPQADLLGSINRIYGVPGRVEPGRELSRHRMASSPIEAGRETMTTAAKPPADRSRRRSPRPSRSSAWPSPSAPASTSMPRSWPPSPIRTTIACAIRSRSRKPTARSWCSSATAAAASTAAPARRRDGLAQTWLRESTGAIIVDVPAGTPNARSAADAMREIQAMFAAAGVPPRGVSVRPYRPARSARISRRSGSAIRRSRRPPAPAACGRRTSARPDKNKSYYENKHVLQFRLRPRSAISPR